MELRHLRYFIRVAEEENVSRAAAKLHVSQPALSRQVRDLESELGFPLFERTAKSLRLTPAGRVFLPEARAVLEQAENAVRTARAAASGGIGEVNAGYAPSLTARILPRILRAFQQEFPRVRVRLRDLSTEEMLRGVRDGDLHVALVPKPPPAMLQGLHFEELLRDPVYLAVSPNHPLAGRRSVTLVEAAKEPVLAYSRNDYPEVHHWLGRLFATLKRKPRVLQEHDSASSLIAAVEAGSGVAPAPESLSCIAGERLRFLPLSPAVEPLVVGAVWSRLKRLAPEGEHFLQASRRAAGEYVAR